MTNVSTYNQLYQQASNPSAAAPIQMNSGQANGNQSLQSYMQTPEYQLLYGSKASQDNSSAVANGTYDPTQAFHNDPGFNFGINQGFQQLQNQYAAKGLGQSGPLMQAMQQYAQGAQNQSYQQYLGQQSNLFGSYQSQLQQLAGMGANAANAQGQSSVTSGNQLAGILAGGNLATGQNIAQGNLSTGQNISQLLANLGINNASGISNTASAQANNIYNGNLFAAQIAANNQASNAQSQSSLFQGAGALNGASIVAGGGSGGGFSGYGNTTNYNNGQSTYTGNPMGPFGKQF